MESAGTVVAINWYDLLTHSSRGLHIWRIQRVAFRYRWVRLTV